MLPGFRHQRTLLFRAACEVLAALMIVVVADRLLAWAFDGVRPTDYRAFIETRRVFPEDSPPQILVLGDSHIADAYVPGIVEASTGWTSFNFAVYGSGPIEWYFLANDLLLRTQRPPQMVVIGTNPEMFFRVTSAGRYTPDLIKSTRLRVALLRHSGLDHDWFLLLESYRQRDLVPALVRHLRGLPGSAPVRLIRGSDAGYLRSVRHMQSQDELPLSSHPNTINPTQIQAFRDLLALLVRRDIEVIVVDPPVLPTSIDATLESSKFVQFDRILSRSLGAHGIRRFDFRNSRLARTLDYHDFLNAHHVCASGAAFFSTALGEWLANPAAPQDATLSRALQARAANPCVATASSNQIR